MKSQALLFFASYTSPIIEETNEFWRDLTMKKFLLVLLIGTVLVINLYGVVNEFMVKEEVEIDHIAETTVTVYME